MELPRPRADILPNTLAFETEPLVHPTGFREYDARWWFGFPGSGKAPELNLVGVQALGLGLGALLAEKGLPLDVVVGHDFRAYSGAVKQALTAGLMAAGAHVHDIGLALTPMAYFAQFALPATAVAMVTASHNDNGWTGVKMGADRPVTFGPQEMGRLKEIVLGGLGRARGGGAYSFHADMRGRYLADLGGRPRLRRPIRVVAACGNGTAGAFAPELLSRLGADVIPLDATLDHSFPRYNPNPEDLGMLAAIAEAVLEHGAEIGLGFDGDGDRCGVVDETGRAIFADKMGVMLARDLAAIFERPRFVVDVKSTSLFRTDPVLAAHGASAEYWMTGHSHIKRRVRETGALAGFEKSGHFFFAPPIGRGYDDGLATALAVLDMLDRNPGRTVGDLYAALPRTWSSPTMSPHCPDEAKYGVVERVRARLEALRAGGGAIGGAPITDLVTVNGVRAETADGTWGLVRASSNKPELVVVVESPVSQEKMRAIFADLDALIRENPEVGPYNQTL